MTLDEILALPPEERESYLASLTPLEREQLHKTLPKGERAPGFEDCPGCIFVDLLRGPCIPGQASYCPIAWKAIAYPRG